MRGDTSTGAGRRMRRTFLVVRVVRAGDLDGVLDELHEPAGKQDDRVVNAKDCLSRSAHTYEVPDILADALDTLALEKLAPPAKLASAHRRRAVWCR